MLPIHFAPIQGHTDITYRTLHATIMGGIEEYYTPFIRWEKGTLRNKDRRDIEPSQNTQNTTVQLIFKDLDEFKRLTDAVVEMGWSKVDLNMGCPFPLQVHAGRGAGLLQHPDTIELIANEISKMKEIVFTAKMRLGQESEDEGLRALEILDQAGLKHIALHPRLGKQQYKGKADREAYGRFLERCSTPMIYNGDLATLGEMHEVEAQFPKTAGLMIGRGLLARPTLAMEYRQGSELPESERQEAVKALHEGIWQYANQHLQGESQILSRMQSFWEPLEPALDKKQFKALTRCGTLRKYREAVATLWR